MYVCTCLPCSYETACEEYIKALEILCSTEEENMSSSHKSINAPVIAFIVNRVSGNDTA